MSQTEKAPRLEIPLRETKFSPRAGVEEVPSGRPGIRKFVILENVPGLPSGKSVIGRRMRNQ